MRAIAFSKDRALQLDAFLRSYARYVSLPAPLDVLFSATSPAHLEAYGEVFERHASVATPHAQTDFYRDFLALLPAIGRVVFFVDDQVFVRPWAVEERTGLSLRLGRHLTRCYPTNAPQPLPAFEANGEMLSWRWAEGQGDWGYPVSLDGHVFDAREIREAADGIGFRAPNSLEEALRLRLRGAYAGRWGLCYPESRVVNVPWNKVQTECGNRHGEQHGAEEMLRHWQEGDQIALPDGLVNESAHQELPLRLEPRQ